MRWVSGDDDDSGAAWQPRLQAFINSEGRIRLSMMRIMAMRTNAVTVVA